ncbi:MAG: AAA family ATPase, partial [Planctomycetes bacterium]|nr:AAA family ATPase [Planctomycetota bacterium]
MDSEIRPPDPAAHAPSTDPLFGKMVDEVQAVRREVNKAVIGQRVVIEQVLAALMAGGHVLI